MIITRTEANQIAKKITPLFSDVLNEYDFRKYPADDYSRIRNSFSSLTASHDDIEGALVWKWGHWGKSNYPKHHRNLIVVIQSLWLPFVASGFADTPAHTFQWWNDHLNNRMAYITVAFIAHLIHHKESFPIIDQHNFRAMNYLVDRVGQVVPPKKKPSDWGDIEALKSFMTRLTVAMPGRTFSEIDRFLMMYGRNHVPR